MDGMVAHVSFKRLIHKLMLCNAAESGKLVAFDRCGEMITGACVINDLNEGAWQCGADSFGHVCFGRHARDSAMNGVGLRQIRHVVANRRPRRRLWKWLVRGWPP